MNAITESAVKRFAESIQTGFTTGVVDEAKRQEAIGSLEQLNFPTSRVEAWKYTRVTKISKKEFYIQSAAIKSIDSFKIKNLDSHVLVFVNGFFQKELSSTTEETGIEISPLSNSTTVLTGHLDLPTDDVFNALNTAFSMDGVAIKIGAGKSLSKPVEVIHIQTGNAVISNSRNSIIAEKNTQAHILFNYYSENASQCFSNVVTEIEVGVNAQLTIDKIQCESDENYFVSTEQVTQDKDSIFTINTITLNGELVRNNLNIAVNGSNCTTNLYGAYLTKGKQHVDNHTVVDHKVAHCNSNELYKGVMDDDSTAVFNGKVFVRKDAQKINAFQSNGNVLLSGNATVNSKPELEIYADDVKCSHGSTTGQLDEDAVFYLRARGLSDKNARKLLVSAFIGDVLNNISSEAVRAHIDKILFTRFGWEF
jgi:Fe-S cluster assembly protein SufD